MALWESWTVIGLFLVNLIFVTIMAFVTPYFKTWTLGKILNLVWILLIIISAAVVMTYNVKCTLSKGEGMSCNIFVYSIIGLITIVTVGNITFGIYNAMARKKGKPMITQEYLTL